nr:hypothetical protein [Tanacetum cinerariifolium]
MAQQIFPADQLISKFQSIGRCNNYDVLQIIPCSSKCKIVGKILLDHPLGYALTATVDVSFVHLQQFWQIVHKVHDTKDTIRFKLDTQEITYIVDMFRATLKLPVETPDNPFVAPVTIEIIESFMNRVGYQVVVDNDYIQYPCFTKLIIDDLMKKYETIPLRIKEDYHSIKDDIPLVSVYSLENVLFQGMQILDAFLTKEIRATDDYKEYETMFFGVDVTMNQLQLVVSIQGTHRTNPSSHRTPTFTATSPRRKKMKQRARELKLDEEEIEWMVEGEEDEESYTSEFVDSILNDDVDDFDTRIEPESHKEHPKVVDDDDVNNIEKKNDERIDDKAEKTDDAEKKDNDDHTDHSLIEPQATGSKEIRTKKMQTPIPTTIRSSRKYLSSDKTISEELTTTVSPITATTSKDSSTPKCKKRYISYKMKILLGKVLDHCNKVVPKMTFAKTNEMIKREMKHLVNLAVNKDHEVDPINAQEMISKEFATHGPKMIEELFRKHMQNTTLNLLPIASSSTVDLQQHLYLNMKTKPQDQAADPEL